MDEPGLLRLLETRFTLDREGIHGIRHWERVRENLGRVGVKPSPRRLCTAAARDAAIIEWAYARSLR